MRRPATRTLAAAGLFVALAAGVLALPLAISPFRAQQLAYVGIYAVALVGLNILTGHAGQISLGHGAFMAVGGYTTAILVAGNAHLDGGVRDIWTIPVAAAVAGTAGLLFGLPALRLSGLYLALATFAVAVSVPALLRRFEDVTGGGAGINLFGLPGLTASLEPVSLLGVELEFNDWLYVLCWTVALAGFAAAWLLLRGRTGRALRAIRDSESAAASAGVHVAAYKTLAFTVSAAYCGAAGALLAIATTFVNPDTFPVALSITLLVGVVVGGLGSTAGMLAGAVLIQFLPLWAQGEGLGGLLPAGVVEQTRLPGAPAMVYGIVLIVLMLVLPHGVGSLLRRAGHLPLGRRAQRRRAP